MSKSLAPSLREAIFSRIAESDGCYLLVYSGSEGKLSFLSSLLGKPRDDLGTRLLFDSNLRQYNGKWNCEGCTLIDSLSGKRKDESRESFCLRIIREQLRKFDDSGRETSRILVVVDCSMFLNEAQEPLTDGVFSFHKNVIDLIGSINGGAGVLLYDIDCLNEKLIAKLLGLHGSSQDSQKALSLQVLKDEVKKRVSASGSTTEILAFNEAILFIDPVSNSTVLVPVTDIIREILPRDPLSIAHRDIAFANNYTAYEGACPYLSPDVSSQCLLDPNIVKAVKTRGQSFVQGRPCITAVDHMILEEMPEKKEEPKKDGNVEGGNLDGSSEYSYGLNDRSRTGCEPCPVNSYLDVKLKKTALDYKGSAGLHP